MADIKIDRAIISTPLDYGEVEERLGLGEEFTSLPEWQGWDRIENCGYFEAPSISPLDLNADLSPLIDQLRNDPEYNSIPDLDEKAFFLDVLTNISTKLDTIVQEKGSERLQIFQENLNELLELYQIVYVHQLGSIKG